MAKTSNSSAIFAYLLSNVVSLPGEHDSSASMYIRQLIGARRFVEALSSHLHESENIFELSNEMSKAASREK